MSKTDKLLDKLLERINAAPPADKPLEDHRDAIPMDDITRHSHVRMIRSLTKAYRHCGFQLLVDQATIGKADIEDLGDCELVALHRDLDRARECLSDGITFEEAGLLRSSHG